MPCGATQDGQVMVERSDRMWSTGEENEKAGLKLNIQKMKTMASSPITLWKKRGNNGNSDRFFFPWAPNSMQMVAAAMKLKDACSLEEKL